MFKVVEGTVSVTSEYQILSYPSVKVLSTTKTTRSPQLWPDGENPSHLHPHIKPSHRPRDPTPTTPTTTTPTLRLVYQHAEACVDNLYDASELREAGVFRRELPCFEGL